VGRSRAGRSAYHHGNLRAALVTAATGLLADGPLGVTLRGAARRAGVSQAAPYRHFSDKSALLAAVAEDGFHRLRRAIVRAARPHRRNPVAALRAMAMAVVRFAAAHPSHYRLMCGPAVRGRDHPALRDAAVAAWQLLSQAIADCQRAGRIRAGDPVELAFALWCTVHGLAVLAVDEQIPADVLRTVPLDELAEHATRCLLEGLAPRPS
jgi:AcrR family transcriptional regulator